MTANQLTFFIWSILAEYLGHKEWDFSHDFAFSYPPDSTEFFTGSSLRWSPARFMLSFLLSFFNGRRDSCILFKGKFLKSCLWDEIPPWLHHDCECRLQTWAVLEIVGLLSLGAWDGITVLQVSLWCRSAQRWKQQPLLHSSGSNRVLKWQGHIARVATLAGV